VKERGYHLGIVGKPPSHKRERAKEGKEKAREVTHKIKQGMGAEKSKIDEGPSLKNRKAYTRHQGKIGKMRKGAGKKS